MSIPKFEQFLFPFLSCLKDGKKKQADIISFYKKHFDLSSEDCLERTRGGNITRLLDRFKWTVSYLRRADLIYMVDHETYELTPFGKQYVMENTTLSIKAVKEMHESLNALDVTYTGDGKEIYNGQTPTEVMLQSLRNIEDELLEDLKEKVQSMHPRAFEHLVFNLLIKMGYGDVESEQTMVTQYSHDGGIDGVIAQDKLGLDKIYIQAKRYNPQSKVCGREVRDFIGALAVNKVNKGIFITTSDFDTNAHKNATQGDKNVVLINGERLMRLMLDHNVGVSIRSTHHVKRIDSDFFDEWDNV